MSQLSGKHLDVSPVHNEHLSIIFFVTGITLVSPYQFEFIICYGYHNHKLRSTNPKIVQIHPTKNVLTSIMNFNMSNMLFTHRIQSFIYFLIQEEGVFQFFMNAVTNRRNTKLLRDSFVNSISELLKFSYFITK